MSQLTKTNQLQSIEDRLEAAGLTPDTDDFAAAGAMVRSGGSIDEAAAKYGGGGNGAIATRQSSSAVARKKSNRGNIAPVDLTVAPASASGDLVGAHKAGVAVGYGAIDPLLESYEGGVQAGVSAAVEASQLRVQNFLNGAIGGLGTSFSAFASEDD